MIISLKGGHPLQWFGIFLGYWCRFKINYLFIQQIILYLIIFEKYFCSIVSNISREKRSITNWLVVNDVWCPQCVNISHQRRSPPSLISTLSSSSPVSSLHTQTDQWEARMESPDQTVDQSESCSCQTERWAQYFSILALHYITNIWTKTTGAPPQGFISPRPCQARLEPSVLWIDLRSLIFDL